MKTRVSVGLIAVIAAAGVAAAPEASAVIRHHASCETLASYGTTVSPVIVNGVTVGGHVVKRSTIRIDCPGWRHDTATSRSVTKNVSLAELRRQGKGGDGPAPG